MRARIFCLCVLLLAQATSQAAPPVPEGTIQVGSGDLAWKPGPATMPADVEDAVLQVTGQGP